MDGSGAVLAPQWSGSSSNDSSSPVASPAHPHSRHSSSVAGFSTFKRTQHVAAKAAARRLAQVIVSQAVVYHDEEDDDGGDYLGLRFARPRFTPHHTMTNNGASASTNGLHSSSPSPEFGRNSTLAAGSLGAAGAATVPANVLSGDLATVTPVELPITKLAERRLIPYVGNFGLSKDDRDQADAIALCDELDVLQEENYLMLEKLRLAEEKYEEAEARARQLEQQVASLGEGISLEAKLLSRKEAALCQREAALNADKQDIKGKKEEIAALCLEIQNLKDESTTTMDHFQEVLREAKGLRTVTKRMILSQEEMEEVVLKRCWLARYWGLAMQYGICEDIAASKYEHWLAFAPLPFEVVISAGQKAKEDFLIKDGAGENVSDKSSKCAQDPGDLSGEGNIETLLSVEMGLRELASLKIEDAIVLAMAQQRCLTIFKDLKFSDDPKPMEALELSQEESDDVVFKQAWLIFFWKRANDYGVEEDIAEERLQHWTSCCGKTITLHDSLDVDRGLVELRKLGIEQQLWKASRREPEQPKSKLTENGTQCSQSEACA